MIARLLEFLQGLPNETITVIIAALPIAELRGSIPVGYCILKMPLLQAVLWSIVGNMLPVIPVLFLLEPISERLRRFHVWRRFFDWLFERTKKKAELVQRYEALGLMLFVAVPLPMTGAWTGCIAASLFKIRFRYAFAAIFFGVIIAGIIVTALVAAGVIVCKVGA